jgi:hypothetical protein
VGISIDAATLGTGNTCRSIPMNVSGDICDDACACPGDFAAPFGGTIDINDLTSLLAVYGLAPTNPCMDMAAPFGGVIDLNDLTAFLAVYGRPCP